MTEESFNWKFSTESDLPKEREILARMLSSAKDFARAMQQNATPYVFSLLGVSETGKTMLAKDVNRFFSRHVSTYIHKGTGATLARSGGRIEWRHVCEEARNRNYDLLRDLREDWFVCLDDVGAEHQTESKFTISVLDDILNARAGKRWTMITANKTMKEINDDWDTRIASRLQRDGGVIVSTKGVRLYTTRQKACQ